MVLRKLNADLQEQIRYLKQNYPRMSAFAIFRQLYGNDSILIEQVFETIVNYYVNQHELDFSL